jgi:hypothetical protein
MVTKYCTSSTQVPSVFVSVTEAVTIWPATEPLCCASIMQHLVTEYCIALSQYSHPAMAHI